MTTSHKVALVCVLMALMIISIGISLQYKTFAQTNNSNASNSNTTLSLMTSLAKGLATYALRNVTMTTAQCDIARHLPIVPENKTIAKSTSALIGYTAGREAALNACMKVGK